MSLSTVRKAVTTFVGVALMVLTEVTKLGVVPTAWVHIVSAIVGVLTVISTYAVPNAPVIKAI